MIESFALIQIKMKRGAQEIVTTHQICMITHMNINDSNAYLLSKWKIVVWKTIIKCFVKNIFLPMLTNTPHKNCLQTFLSILSHKLWPYYKFTHIMTNIKPLLNFQKFKTYIVTANYLKTKNVHSFTSRNSFVLDVQSSKIKTTDEDQE